MVTQKNLWKMEQEDVFILVQKIEISAHFFHNTHFHKLFDDPTHA